MCLSAAELSGCASEPEKPERLGSAQQAIGNGDLDSAGKYNSVVQVNVDGRGNCSGVVVTPKLVLTANHCVTGTRRDGLECVAAVGAGLGDLQAGATIRFFESGNGFYPTTPTFTDVHTFATSGELVPRSIEDMDLCFQSEAAKDLALVRLDQRVSTEDFKPMHPPILGNPDLTFAPSCLAPVNSDDFVAVAIGYGHDNVVIDLNPFNGDFDIVGSNGNPERQRLYKETEDWFQTGGVLRNEWLVTSTYEGNLKGDSGGPLTVNGRLCGISTRFVPTSTGLGAEYVDLESGQSQAFLQANVLDVTKTHFVGECNPGDPKPWPGSDILNTDIGEEMVKATADGMPDGCDPCPFATEADPRGDFTRGADNDEDGVPDRCDNCPPDLCSARGLPPSFCKNPYPAVFGPQPDQDKDGVGDACDSCPSVPNKAENFSSAALSDPDNDQVANSCDNCSKRNAVKACKTDAECTYVTAVGTVKEGHCIDIGRYGKCDDDDGWACFEDAGNGQCRDDVLCKDPTHGRCDQQVDDVNDNGIGGQCDSCDGAPSVSIFANSNRLREQMEAAEPLGDTCDPVPVYASRVVADFPNQGYDAQQRTRFTSTAGIGRDGDNGYNQPVVQLTAGFRWCNCHDATKTDPEQWNKPLDECVLNDCIKNPQIAYDPPPGLPSSYVHVSTKTYPVTNLPPSYPGSGTDQTVTRFFTGVTSTDLNLHPHGEAEQQRVGFMENLLWDHAADIASGAVTSYDVQGTVHSAGAFWSHVEDDKATYASKRDLDYFTVKGNAIQGLRDHYSYVVTPELQLPAPLFIVPACVGSGNCYPVWRSDLLRDPTISRVSPTLAELGPTGGILQCSGGCTAVGPAGYIDVTSAVPPVLETLLMDSSRVFLPPVERGSQLFTEAPASVVMGVSLPRAWSPDAAISDVGFDGSRLFPLTRVLSSLAAPTLASEGKPGERTDPLYALTLKQSALYMVGGRSPAGGATGEIWRQDRIDASWTLLLHGEDGGLADPAPTDVQALGFDPRHNQLAFVDFTQKEVGKKGKHHGHHGKKNGWSAKSVPVARLVVFNTATHDVRVVAVFPRLNVFDRIDLIARGDQSWVLVGRMKNHKVWLAFELTLDAAGALEWTGIRPGVGAVLDAPINTSDGVLLPIRKGNRIRFERLEASDFVPSGVGCKAM